MSSAQKAKRVQKGPQKGKGKKKEQINSDEEDHDVVLNEDEDDEYDQEDPEDVSKVIHLYFKRIILSLMMKKF